MRFLWIFAFVFAASSAHAQTHSQFFDYIGLNAYWNGSSWTSYAAGYSNMFTTNTSTGDFTLYTGGNAASAGLARTMVPAMTVTAGGSVSASGLTVNGTISTTALYVNGVAITSSGGGGGTSATMVAGWPDAIVCTASVGGFTRTEIFYAAELPNSSTGRYMYAPVWDDTNANYSIMYNSSGAFITGNSWTSTNCNQSIVQLYAAGQAFNFVGNGGANGVNGYDNIVSSTTKVTANNTGTISLTTGGVTTGYFDTAGRLVVPGVSTTGPISATSIKSAGGVSFGSYSGAPVTCAAGYKGMVVMNSTDNLCLCNGTSWVGVGTGGTACAW